MTSPFNGTAAAAGVVTPAGSEEAAPPGRPKVSNESNRNFDSAAPGADPQGKLFSNLRAQLALAGWQLSHDGAGGYVVCRWGHSRNLGNLEAVVAFARHVGAAI